MWGSALSLWLCTELSRGVRGETAAQHGFCHKGDCSGPWLGHVIHERRAWGEKTSDFVPFPSTLTIAARSPQRRIAALLSSAATDRSKTKSFPPPARPGERRGDGDTLGRLGLLWPKAEAFVGHQFPLLTSCRSAAVLWLRLWGIAQTPQIKATPDQSCSPGPLVSLPPAP